MNTAPFSVVAQSHSQALAMTTGLCAFMRTAAGDGFELYLSSFLTPSINMVFTLTATYANRVTVLTLPSLPDKAFQLATENWASVIALVDEIRAQKEAA